MLEPHRKNRIANKFIYGGFANAFLIYAGVVLYSHYGLNLHAAYPRGHDFRQVFILSRTAAAAVSLFLFFPLVWLLRRKADATAAEKRTLFFLLSMGVAECPAILGLSLFLFFAAFKTFFVFWILSVFYFILIRPPEA